MLGSESVYFLKESAKRLAHRRRGRRQACGGRRNVLIEEVILKRDECAAHLLLGGGGGSGLSLVLARGGHERENVLLELEDGEEGGDDGAEAADDRRDCDQVAREQTPRLRVREPAARNRLVTCCLLHPMQCIR